MSVALGLRRGSRVSGRPRRARLLRKVRRLLLPRGRRRLVRLLLPRGRLLLIDLGRRSWRPNGVCVALINVIGSYGV